MLVVHMIPCSQGHRITERHIFAHESDIAFRLALQYICDRRLVD